MRNEVSNNPPRIIQHGIAVHVVGMPLPDGLGEFKDVTRKLVTTLKHRLNHRHYILAGTPLALVPRVRRQGQTRYDFENPIPLTS